MRDGRGGDAGTVELPDAVFGIEPNVVGDAPGRHRAARRRARRHAQHQDPRRGPRRRREAVAPEGHRPRPPGFDPLAAVARRRRRARPEAARLPATHPEEDGEPRAAFGALGPLRARQGRRRLRLADVEPRTKDAIVLLAGARPAHRGHARPSGCSSCSTARKRRSGSRSATSASVCRSSCTDELNAYDVLVNDSIVFSRATLDRADRAVRRDVRAMRAVDDRRVEAEPERPTPTTMPNEPRSPRHHRAPRRVREVVRVVRRQRLHVHRRARREQDRDPQGVETIFNVRVTNVNTINRKGKRKRNRRTGTWSARPDQRRALVSLAEGDRIEIFGS